MSRERPIIFGAESVRAILSSRKTQTRRVVKQPCNASWIGGREYQVGEIGNKAGCIASMSPYGAPGDRLWVRETWGVAPGTLDEERQLRHRATQVDPRGWPARRGPEEQFIRWRSPILMPRWASRLTLEVVSVRVERLQEISVGDIRAEGFEEPPLTPGVHFCIDGELWPAGERKIREAFGSGWDTINCKRAPWASNPWVWVVEFRLP